MQTPPRTRRFAVLFCAAILVLPQLAFPADLPVAKPESAGMSSARLDRIDTWLRGIVSRKEAAGFVSLVARRGKVVHHKAFGTRGLDVAEPMPLDAQFDLASMTKPITVVAALTLLEEGRFALTDSVSTYLPEFRGVRVETAPGTTAAPKRAITVKDLFTHTSGIHDSMSRAESMKFPTLAEYVKALIHPPLRYEPGTTYLYGSSHHVLGYLTQQVSATPLDRLVQERILTPLGMSDTAYWPDDAKKRAVLVVNGKDDPTSASRVPPEAARAKTFIGGASGLYSTAADYWRFSQMLLNGGMFNGHRVLGPRTINWMAQDQIENVASFTIPGTRFGLGVAVVSEPGSANMPYSKGTYYWSGSQGTLFWIDPAEQLIGVLMVQLTPNRLKLREKFTALVYAAITE